MSEQISKERLAELIAKGPIIPFGVGDTISALRELQERREREGSVMKPQSATPRTQKVYIADMEDTLTQLANIVGIPRDADLLIQRVRELAALKELSEQQRFLIGELDDGIDWHKRELAALKRALTAQAERIATLEAAVRQWASECAECNGTGNSGNLDKGDEHCPQCADMRAALEETQG